MTPLDRLIEAHTEADVVAAVADYSRSQARSELAKFPEAGRPGAIRDAGDVISSYISLKLERALRQDAGIASGPGLELMDFFRTAAHKIRRLKR